ncbi:tetratricopeptide (TPR) repeat protein [Polymorphobacter multimanifer]|uniref:Tetratricopeptide (TPR) repeat protein n=2 Tax=Polymorphobacter multimanifer TaxID=1070431 RepID=A0A841L9T2_9SPHN|nr:hypothetical protein [Polymorphobacter multimanifer]MBB6229190.1 tetratricopeptide (TPR) repeat protein [Polymorphobacter multimanifer]
MLLLLFAFATPAQAEWLVAETEHFRIHGDVPEQLIRDRAALLEDYRGLLGALTNVGAAAASPAPRLDVYLVGNIAKASPFGRTRPDIAGFYTAGPGGVQAYAVTVESGLSILLHEYAHHFMLASGSGTYPAWYVEGFAEYFMTARFTPDQVEFGAVDRNRASFLVGSEWLPMADLLAAPVSGGVLFYAQSWGLTHYMFRAPGQLPKLQAYLLAVANRTGSVEAFKTHVAEDLRAFQGRLRGYLMSRKITLTRFKRPPATPANVVVRKLPAAAEDLLLPIANLERLPSDSPLKNRAIEVITRAAARHPGDPMAERALALLALRFGDRKEAADRLDALLEQSPADATLLLWRAEATPQDTPDGRAEALRALVRAYKANPEDWRTLRAYALARGARTTRLGDSDLDVLQLAWQLAPQVPEVAVDFAAALVHAGRPVAAARILAPVANSPHGGRLAILAKTLMTSAEAGNNQLFFDTLFAKPQEDATEAP